MTYDDKWFEVWFSEGTEVVPYYLLIVTPDQINAGQVLVLDPKENNKVVHQGQSYEDTLLWLKEDEYSPVEGRVFPDDGW
jgi:hypothetical protein